MRDAYGVAAVDPRLPMEPWMAEALLSARPRRRGLKTSVLDADTAWTHVLEHHLELPDGRPDPASIIRWSMEPGAAERFTALPPSLAEAVARRFEETGDRARPPDPPYSTTVRARRKPRLLLRK